jgi:hypothetical protein
MKKHKLLVYQLLSQRYRALYFWLWLVLLILAVYDYTTQPLFGDVWPLVWLAWPIAFILWLYYGPLMRRASVQLQPRSLVIQGPLRAMRISYGRIAAITSTQLFRHHDPKQYKGRDHTIIETIGGHTCLHIELNSYPKQYQERYRWYNRFLFSERRPGLLLVVDDWMALSRQLETARSGWHEQHKASRQEDRRSLAARVLDQE